MKRVLVILVIVGLMLSCRSTEKIESDGDLNGNWELVSMDGQPLKLLTFQSAPFLTIDKEKKSVGGNDGCNSIFSSMENVTETNIIFGPIGGTKKYCHPMDDINNFSKQLKEITQYTIIQNLLFLKNGEGKTLLEFKRLSE